VLASRQKKPGARRNTRLSCSRLCMCFGGAEVSSSQNGVQGLTSSPTVGALERAGTVLDDYMTPEQLAAELRRCTRTLDRWHDKGTGPPRVTIGRSPLYRRKAVAQWLLNREEDPNDRGRRRARKSDRGRGWARK